MFQNVSEYADHVCSGKHLPADLHSLTQTLKAHINPKPSEFVQRFSFQSSIQKNSETIAEYVSEIRRVAQH